MRVILQPSGAVGGEPFVVQPKVAVISSGGSISVDFVGSVYALLSESPTGYERLRIGLCNSTVDCGVNILDDFVARQYSVPFVDGIASFKVCMRFLVYY